MTAQYLAGRQWYFTQPPERAESYLYYFFSTKTNDLETWKAEYKLLELLAKEATYLHGPGRQSTYIVDETLDWCLMSLSRTLESLETFIQIQEELVDTARSEIKKLEELKQRALSNPQNFVETLSDQLKDHSFAFPSRTDEEDVLKGIDWKHFKHVDASIIHKVPIPSLRYRPLEPLPPSSVETEIRAIMNDFKPRVTAAMEEAGEFSAEIEDTPPPRPPPQKKRKIAKTKQRDTVTPNSRGVSELAEAEEQPPIVLDIPSKSKSSTPPIKNRPETFKVPWTAHEQHLLERFLLEIPSTERFRWKKISEAMGGTRTARQVMSRVQKYNLKLKKFGL